MRKTRIAIMGTRGSFHEEAASKYFNQDETEFVECGTFNESCLQAANNLCDYTVLAIENSIAGSILPNYSLVSKYNLKIQGEINVPIQLHLITKKNSLMNEIECIQSHPMALRQCENFLLTKKHLRIIEGNDTANCAKELAQSAKTDMAVIASRRAAEIFSLNIAQENVHSSELNYTRFWVLAKGGLKTETANKSTISFETAHQPGSLAQILNVFGKKLVSLSRIQSVPIHNKEGEFKFYCDLEWVDYIEYRKALLTVAKNCKNLELLGEYTKDETQLIIEKNENRNKRESSIA